jgi:predicted flap endonuclease-1-like 5' DNA nuclease
MSDPIEDVEGIGPASAAKLREVGITNTGKFLERAGTSKGREALATETGISIKLILTWANMADLMRISGVGGQYAELLVAAGVDTIKELRTRNAANLAAKMEAVNAERQLTKATASEARVQGWIDQAKTMEPSISH